MNSAPSLVRVTSFYTLQPKRLLLAWIPDYVEKRTEVLLRAIIRSRPSPNDKKGYVYIYQVYGTCMKNTWQASAKDEGEGCVDLRSSLLSDPTRPDVVIVKVGRTNELNRRLSEHFRHCGATQQPVILGYYPSSASSEPSTSEDPSEPSPDGNHETDDTPAAESQSSDLSLAHLQPGEPAPFVQRLERLIHLELADVETNAPYLSVHYPGKASRGLRLGTATARTPCASCECGGRFCTQN